MILVETWYEVDNGKLLAIVEAFKTWSHYLKGCKYKVRISRNYNNLRHFIDTRTLNFKQVGWAQKLSWYYFWIDYCYSKANRIFNAFSKYFQWNVKEKTILRVKNTKILYQLQFFLTKIFGLLAKSISLLHLVFIWDTIVML